jgi:hypothetical protein
MPFEFGDSLSWAAFITASALRSGKASRLLRRRDQKGDKAALRSSEPNIEAIDGAEGKKSKGKAPKEVMAKRISELDTVVQLLAAAARTASQSFQ